MSSFLNFTSSVLFGTPGSYQCMGMPITFGEKKAPTDKAESPENNFIGLLTFDSFRHELCHTIAFRLFFSSLPRKLTVYSNNYGETIPDSRQKDKQTRIGKIIGPQNSLNLTTLAGPVLNMAAICIHLKIIEKISQHILQNFIYPFIYTKFPTCERNDNNYSNGVMLALYFMYASLPFLLPCFCHMTKEIKYAFNSSRKMDTGDFGTLRRNLSKCGFAAAVVALAVPSIFAAYQFVSYYVGLELNYHDFVVKKCS